jgi:sugar/nucleoside kinase (ribokinase family)
MSADGGRISIFLNAGTFTPIIDSERLHPIIQTSDYILLNIINYARSLIPAIQQYKKPIWCDLHDYDGVNPYHHDFVQAADYVFMSSDAMPDYRAFMQQLIAAGKQLVVCTHGRRGATALSQASGWLEVPAASGYAALDTNGAGDAFMAGYIYGHAQGWDVLRCLQTATIAAGLAVTSRELAAERLEPELVLQEHQRLYGPAE